MKKIFTIVLHVLLLQSLAHAQYDWPPPADHLSVRFSLNGTVVNQADTGVVVTANNCVLSADNAGHDNCAYGFNGIDSYISAASPAKIDSSLSAFTISLFVKPAVFPASVFTKMTGHCNEAGLALSLSPDTVYLATIDTIIWFLNPAPLTESQWHHVVLTWDGDTIRYFLDGTIAGKSAYF